MTIGLLAIFLAALATGVAIHIIVWRISRPKDDAAALFKLVVILPLVGSCLGALFLLRLGGLELVDALLLAGIFHLGTGFVYMSLYTASQAASPTSLILLRLAQARSDGLDEAEVVEQFTWQQLSGDSVQSAIDEGFLSGASDGALSLAPRGRALLRTCSTLRRFIGLGQGRG